MSRLIRVLHYLLLISLFAFFLLASYKFFKGRIIHLDTSFLIFKLIQDPSSVFSFRVGAYFSYLPTLLNSIIGLPLKWLVFIQSMWFALIHLIINVIILFLRREKFLAIAHLSSLIIASSVSFHYPASEVFNLVSYIFLFIAVFESGMKRRKIALVLLSILIGLTHPVFIFLLPAVLIYLNKGFDKVRVIKSIGIYAISLVSYFLISINSYDRGKMSISIDELSSFKLEESFPFIFFKMHFYKSELLSFFDNPHYFIPNYDIVISLLLLGIVGLIVLKKYLKALFYSSITLLVFLLVCYSESAGNSFPVLDKSFMPLGFFTMLIWLENVKSERKSMILVVSLLLIPALSLKFFDIYSMGERLNTRYYTLSDLLKKKQSTPNQKFVATAEDLKQIPHLGVSWNLGVETLFISTMEKEFDRNITLIKQEDYGDKQLIGKESVFIGPPFWAEIEDDKLNPTYFELEGVYQKF